MNGEWWNQAFQKRAFDIRKQPVANFEREQLQKKPFLESFLLKTCAWTN